jgi:hypothetical protein
MLAKVPESKLATMVGQLRSGRNSQFATNMQEILAVPWFHQSGAENKPLYYSPDHSMPDWKLGLTKWDD